MQACGLVVQDEMQAVMHVVLVFTSTTFVSMRTPASRKSKSGSDTSVSPLPRSCEINNPKRLTRHQAAKFPASLSTWNFKVFLPLDDKADGVM